MADADPVLDRTERSLIERTLAWLRTVQPRESAVLWTHVKRVARLGELLDQAPSVLVPSQGGIHGDPGDLALELSQLDPMAGELPLPERAHLARAFLLTKIGLLREFQTALVPGTAGAQPALHAEVHDELSQSVYTLIGVEILLGLVVDRGVPEAHRRRAARQLLLLWERAGQLEIDDFCPMLESAWRARSRFGVHFGALLGAGEFMRLAASDCPSDFLDYFCRDDVAKGEVQAFEEFLFNVPHEDLERLRAESKDKVTDLAAAVRILGRPLDEATAVDDPEALFRSYWRRRTAADFRRWTGAPGPQRTAEAYIMEHVLDGSSPLATSEYRAIAYVDPLPR